MSAVGEDTKWKVRGNLSYSAGSQDRKDAQGAILLVSRETQDRRAGPGT